MMAEFKIYVKKVPKINVINTLIDEKNSINGTYDEEIIQQKELLTKLNFTAIGKSLGLRKHRIKI